jgi:16S rRNA (adenine1518-N6/adenine1519-N6)-dimethyltransferase
MRAQELKVWLQQYNFLPKKSFGQHFLCQESILRGIAQCVVGNKVLEIGPGPGCLTSYLLENPDRELIVIEKDPEFRAILHARAPRAQWVCADALTLDWASYSGFSVASNLPYNVSVPLMLQYAQNGEHLGPAVFMMQKEVAERVVAKTSTKDYGRLSVMLQTFMDIQWVLDVPPAAFWPKPLVDSAVLIFTPKKPWPAISFQRLSSVVAQAFANRRRMLHHNVRIDPEIWGACGIDSRRRAETLSISEFSILLRSIIDHRPLHKESNHVAES